MKLVGTTNTPATTSAPTPAAPRRAPELSTTPRRATEVGVRADFSAPERQGPNPKLARLIAAVVPGRVDFTASDAPAHSASESIPMYRRPADRHAAATAINAGRLIDVRG